MRVLFVLACVAGLASACGGPKCDASGVLQGNVFLRSDDDVRASAGCTTVIGNVTIGRTPSFIGPFDVNGPPPTSLAGLESLVEVAGTLTIEGVDEIETLDGLSGLQHVGGLVVRSNPRLTSLGAMSSLTSFGSFIVENNAALTSFDLAAVPPLPANTIVIFAPQVVVQNNPRLPECEAVILGRRVGSGCTCAGNEPAPGTLTVASAADIAAFEGQTCIVGDLNVLDSDLTTLTGLEALTSVTGALNIRQNSALTSLDGLEGLRGQLTSLVIFDNDSLTNLTALDGLGTASSLDVSSNSSLQSLDGLDGLVSISDSIVVARNPALADVDGLAALTAGIAGRLTIKDNATLTSISGLRGIRFVRDGMEIANNPQLTSLDGLVGLLQLGDYGTGDVIISNNIALTSIDGLSNVTGFIGGDLFIGGNYALTTLDGLDALTQVFGNLRISGLPAGVGGSAVIGVLENLGGLGQITSVSGALIIDNNPALNSLGGLDALVTVTQGLAVRDNPALSQCAVADFAARFPGATCDCDGNLDCIIPGGP